MRVVLSVVFLLLATYFTPNSAVSCSTNMEYWLLECSDVFQTDGYGVTSFSLQAKRCDPNKKVLPGQCADPLTAEINVTFTAPLVSTQTLTFNVDLTKDVEITVLSGFIYVVLHNLQMTATSAQFTIGVKICPISCSIASKTADIYTVKFGNSSVDPCTLPPSVQCPGDNCDFKAQQNALLAANNASVSAGAFYAVLIILVVLAAVEAVFIVLLFRKWRALAGGCDYNLFS